MPPKTPKKTHRDEPNIEGLDVDGEADASRPAKRARTPQLLHADIQALVERICDVEALKEHVKASDFHEKEMNLETLEVFAIKQGLTWLRAIEQELLKIGGGSPDSLAQLSQSCFKAVGFPGAGCPSIDSVDKMKAKVQALESLVDIENVYGRLIRIAAGGGKKKVDSSDEEDEGDDAAALIEADAAAQKKKRPMTAFFRFIADRREALGTELRAELGTESIKPTLIVKRASEMWKALSEADRDPWEGPFKAEKEVYDKEKADKKAKEDAEEWEVDPLPQRQYRMLGCHLAPISRGSPVWCMIAQSVMGTQPQVVSPDGHFVSVDRMFSISRASEEKHYAKNANSQNRRLLWYGGPLASWAGILSNGLRLPQPESPFSGYSFGKGIYFSDMVSVATASSGVGDDGRAIVMLCEVALGKSVERHQADARGSSKLPPGHHSTIGRGRLAPTGLRALPDGVSLPLGPVEEIPPPMGSMPGAARLPHNEYVVYNPAHVRMRYMLEVRLLSGSSQEAITQARAETQTLTEAAAAPLSSKRLSQKTAADKTLLAR